MAHDLAAAAAISDGAVIERSIDEPDLFALVFDRHFDVIYRYLVRRVGRDRAEDLASATFTVAFEQRQRFLGDATTARPWLFGIATNLLRNERRAERRALLAMGSLSQWNPSEQPAHSSDLADVGRLLAKLKREQRDVLFLYAWEDLSYEEISQALGVPVGTVRSRLARARSRLRAVLDEHEPLDTAASEAK